MNLLNKLTYKIKFFWYTWKVKDFDSCAIDIPCLQEDESVAIATLHLPGYLFKTFMHVILTMQLDPKWDEGHINAVAEFLLNNNQTVDQYTLLSFLHPEFYLEDNPFEVVKDEE